MLISNDLIRFGYLSVFGVDFDSRTNVIRIQHIPQHSTVYTHHTHTYTWEQREIDTERGRKRNKIDYTIIIVQVLYVSLLKLILY